MPLDKTLQQVELEIKAGNLGKARDRLHGLISTYPGSLELRKKLGDIYWNLHDFAMAGRYWYLEEQRTKEMVFCCQEFENTFGNDPVQILLALKFKGNVDSILEEFAGRTLLALHNKAKEKYHSYVYNDFRKHGSEKFQPKTDRKSKATNDKWFTVGCVTAFILGSILAIIGLITVLNMVF